MSGYYNREAVRAGSVREAVLIDNAREGDTMTTRDRLIQAVTTYDRKEAEKAVRARRGYHNRFAIGQYFERVDEIAADIAAGTAPRAAIIAGLDGRLRDACLRAIGETKASADQIAAEERRPFYAGYSPVSERGKA